VENSEAFYTAQLQSWREQAALSFDNSSGNVIGLSAADPMRLVQEKFAVAQRGFRVLVNRNDDCLNVVVAPPLARS
jgi:hypothetical protein